MYRSSPVDAPLAVVVIPDAVVALDRRSGAPAWRFLPQNGWSQDFSSPLPRIWIENDAVIVLWPAKGADEFLGLIVHHALDIYCLDYRSGALRWRQRLQELGDAPVLAQANALVDQGQLLITVLKHVYAYSMENGAPQWVQHLGARPLALAIPGVAKHVDQHLPHRHH
jgi:outer membrane protein assembly factor BamB